MKTLLSYPLTTLARTKNRIDPEQVRKSELKFNFSIIKLNCKWNRMNGFESIIF